MNWSKNLQLSIHALTRARWRSLLSASSMSIGITATVLLFGVGGGAERAFRRSLEQAGENQLAISAERTETDALRGEGRNVETLTLADWNAIRGSLDAIERAAPIAMSNFELRRGDRALISTVIGTSPEFQFTNHQLLAAGRFLDEQDLEDRSRVAVIGATIVDELFHGEQALGERILIANSPFVIVGILRSKGLDLTGGNEDDRVLVPVQTAQERLLDVDFLDRIIVQAVSEAELERAEASLRSLLRQRHRIDLESEADDFTIRSQTALRAAIEDSNRSFSRLLAGLAALTLTLASTGLLAVSLLSVKERHGEIGLRLTVGAQPHQVLVQFLAETMMIAFLGAALGLLVGGSGIILGEKWLHWQMTLTWQSLAYPLLIALSTSILFGAYPAWRAARLDPIVALRSS